MAMNVDLDEKLSGLIYCLQQAEAGRGPVSLDGVTWLEMVRRPGLVFLQLSRPGEVVPEMLIRRVCRAVRAHYRPRFVLRSGVAARQLPDGYLAYICWPEGPVGQAWKMPLSGSLAVTKGAQAHV